MKRARSFERLFDLAVEAGRKKGILITPTEAGMLWWQLDKVAEFQKSRHGDHSTLYANLRMRDGHCNITVVRSGRKSGPYKFRMKVDLAPDWQVPIF